MYENDLSHDILKEIFNIGMGKAASMLSEIVNKKIILNIPNIIILEPGDQDVEICQHFSILPEGTLMVSSIEFGEKITGEANLLFPANKMRSFINLCVDQPQHMDAGDLNFTDMDYDIIREIGNIILNSILGEISNTFDISLKYTLPEVNLFDRNNFKDNLKNRKDGYILLLYITFIIEDVKIEGAVIINLTLDSLNELMKMARKMEDDING
jgi:chemotaxis protein CheC